jgi:aminoglycoside phosphotransferase (APT) family kinase protein
MHQLFHSRTLPRFRPQPAPRAPAPSVDTALSAYFAKTPGLRDTSFAEPPALIPCGWEAYIFRFRLRRCGGLPSLCHRPLVLRLYAGPGGLPRARREFAAQTYAYRLGYPVPEPLLLEQDSGPLGGPFVIMEYVPGEALLDRLRGNYLRVLEVPARLADAHARLHALPVHGRDLPRGPFLARHLAELGRTLGNYELDGLRAALRWLESYRPPETESPRLLHLDFHPVNLIVRDDGACVVLDWSEADVGDVHADLATTLLLLRHAPIEGLSLRERLLAPITRWFLGRRYLKAYGRDAAIDRGRLDYYLAWACLRRLATYGMWLRAGPLSNGSKPDAIGRITPGHVRDLQLCFARRTGVVPDIGPVPG